jgi:glycosyltransferase involved in cell wall biosynthesis
MVDQADKKNIERMTARASDIFFSVIVPTYNRGHLIGKTIESILGQTYRNFEVIVVDDGSTDNTEEVVRKYLGPSFFYYRLEHGERSVARNFGTSKARGEYINWFDSDDIMLPHHLEELARIINERNRPALIAVGYEVMQNGEMKYRMRFPAPVLNPYMIRHNFMLTATGIVRKDIAEKFPFNTAAVPREDHELWLRIAAANEVVSMEQVTVNIIVHEESGSEVVAQTSHVYIEQLESFIREVSSNPATQIILNGNLRRFIMYRYVASAYYFAHRGHRKPAMKLLAKSFTSHPIVILRKEFYSVVKNIIFTTRNK